MATAKDYQEDGRKYQVGEVLETDQGNMHVHAVSYQERQTEAGDTERHNFSYTLRHEDDVQAEAKANAEAAKAAQEAEAAATTSEL